VLYKEFEAKVSGALEDFVLSQPEAARESDALSPTLVVGRPPPFGPSAFQRTRPRKDHVGGAGLA